MSRRRKPVSIAVRPVEIVHLLALRPELRGMFPIADVVDAAVREGA